MINLILMLVLSFNSSICFNKDIKTYSNAIYIVESNLNPNAIGDKKFKNYSVGLGQIRLKTGIWIIKRIVPKGFIKKMLLKKLKEVGIRKMLLNPKINIYLSRTYLKWLKSYHGGCIKEAIISYNTGQRAKKYTRSTLGNIYLNRVKRALRVKYHKIY